MIFGNKWRIATFNVGEFPETLASIEKLVSNHGIDIVGITETRLKPEGKMRTNFFTFNAIRPPSEEGRNLGGVSLFLRNSANARLVFKHAEKFFK